MGVVSWHSTFFLDLASNAKISPFCADREVPESEFKICQDVRYMNVEGMFCHFCMFLLHLGSLLPKPNVKLPPLFYQANREPPIG